MYIAAYAAEVQQLIGEGVSLPAGTVVLNVDGDNHRFRGKFRRMRGARIL